MRIELYEENEQKIFGAIDQIRKNHDVEISPTQLVNLLVEAVRDLEFHKEVSIAIQLRMKDEDRNRPPRKKTVTVRSNFLAKNL